jgi:hypothetical protein
MAEQLAIIGFPSSGKTTVLRAACGLSSDQLPAAGELGEHVATIKFAGDERLQWLAKLCNSAKIVPLSVELRDFPGIDLSTELSRQRIRKTVAEVRQCELLVVVLRAFDNPSVPIHRDRIDPAADLDELMEEFVFADMDQLTRRIEKLESQIKKPSPNRDRDQRELALLRRGLSALEAGESLETIVQTTEEKTMLRGFTLLTQRPCVVIINTDEDKLDRTWQLKSYPAVKSILTAAAEYEQQVHELPESDRQTFLCEVNITERLGDRLLKAALDAVDTTIFYTAGEPETRAWPIPSGTRAVDAAAEIHSDLARGFIRAETVHYDDLRACGSHKEARAQGKLRQEGKDYIVRDGDVILFKFNV